MKTYDFTYESLIQHYNNQIKTYGPGVDALQWYSEFTQKERYKIICNYIDEKKPKVLDVGCGCGDLFDYITMKKLDFNYTGIDISAQMIVAAQKAYPSGTFKCLNLNTICTNNNFDYIVASGVFNLKLKDHFNTIIKEIKTMLNYANKKVIINFLSHKVSKWSKSDIFVYTNPQTIINEIKNYEFKLVDKYLPNDVTLIISKK